MDEFFNPKVLLEVPEKVDHDPQSHSLMNEENETFSLSNWKVSGKKRRGNKKDDFDYN